MEIKIHQNHAARLTEKDIPFLIGLSLLGLLLFLFYTWGIPFWLSLGTKQIFSLVSQEMSGRFVSGYAHPEPFYYYLPVFIIGFFPWSLFVFITFIHAIKQRKSMPATEKKQDWIQKKKLHAVCQNNAHVILKREKE